MIIEEFSQNLAKKSIYHTHPEAYEHICSAMIAGLLGNLVRSEEDDLYPNLYSAIIGSTNQGKSSYAKTIKNYISKIQIKKNRQYFAEFKKRKCDIKLLNKKKKEEDQIEIAPDSYPEGVYYEPRSYCIDDSTIEGAFEQAANNSWGNMFLFKDELGGLFDSFSKKGREEDQTNYNMLYQPGDLFVISRKSKDAKIDPIYYPVMNILGCTTRETIEEFLESYQKKGRRDGTFSRFQHVYILPEQKRIDLDFKEPEEVKKDFDKDFIGFITAIIDRQIFVGKQKAIQKLGENYLDEDFITRLKRSPEAEALLREYITSINDERYDHSNILYKEYLGRHRDYVVKQSILNHLQIRYELNQDLWNSEDILIDELSMSKAIKKAKQSKENSASLYGVGCDYHKSLHEQSLLIFNYITTQSVSFYKKYKSDKLWTARDLAKTMAKVLPRKMNGGVDMDLLNGLLDHLAEEEKLHSEDFVMPNKSIVQKYSFKAPNYPHDSTKPEDPKPKKPSEHKHLEVTEYPTKEENAAHIEKLKSSIDAKEYIRQYIKLDSRGMGLCPFHDDKNPSLSVKTNLFKCFACETKGSVIDFEMFFNKVDLSTAIKTIESYANIKLETKKSRLVDMLWREATLDVDRASYLSNRLKDYNVPLNDSLRYSKSVYYKDEEITGNFPALLAKITNSKGEFTGLQRIYLNDEMTLKRDLAQNKKIIGNLGNGFVNLVDSEEADTVVIGEGIETVLSLYLILERDETIDVSRTAVYANLSATNIPELPERFKTIFVARDNDEAGKKYVSNINAKYKDRDVVVPELPEEYNDFNDLFLAEGG